MRHNMKLPILKGIYTDEAADFRTSYPRNMIPVPNSTGIDDGYLRPAEGITTFATANGPGPDRGAINWNGVLYRVMGSDLISIDSGGVITTIGTIGGTDSTVRMDYSFDYLGIISDGEFWLYDGTTLTQNTDPDLGVVLDMVYVDGYWLLTDGEFLIITDLGNPFSVNPTKYGSSEVDPDPIIGLLKIRNEPYALNRNTIEVFQNVGGSGFPFQRVEGTRIDRGSIGTFSKCWFLGTVAFMGGARNESPAIWLGLNADTTKISTREIDTILQEFTEAELETVVLEPKVDRSHQHLLVRLPDRTMVYDAAASRILQTPVWFELSTSIVGHAAFQGQNLCWVYDKWIVGNRSCCVGYLDKTTSEHFGETTGWDFSTYFVYNESNSAIINELELVVLPGRVPLGKDPIIWTSWTIDGETYSQERAISAGKIGERNKRLIWLQQGHFRNYRSQRFRGTSDSHLAVARLEAQIEGCQY